MYLFFFRRCAFLILLTAATGCSTGAHVLTTNDAAEAAQGRIQIATDESGSKTIDLLVTHLAKAQLLVPDATTYVVWLEPLEEASRMNTSALAQNVGVLFVSDDLNARFKMVTSYRRFRILITAERRPNEPKPTGSPILWSGPLS